MGSYGQWAIQSFEGDCFKRYPCKSTGGWLQMSYSFTRQAETKLWRFLRAHGLTFSHYWLLEQIGFCHMNERSLLERSVTESERMEGAFTPISEADAAEALEALMDAAIMQEVDGETLHKIEVFLAIRPRVEGPVAGLPPIGVIDFTPKGAALQLRLERDVFGWPTGKVELAHVGGAGSADEPGGERVTIYATTREWADDAYETGVTVSYRRAELDQVQEIGRWRERWWRLLLRGWRIDARAWDRMFPAE
jgi:hypothetical protein